ncbi:RNA polymerase II-associated protein 3 [Liparis tanakae]|uniref:RNA polymerase II-associated protein 3 n=1 Tax=Liparis tanakae TaxID=230148 RepID=A0A4Z2FR30_9TELE|nr:RNA polymerase II-associated protein 3 [Liparis tanakae]
MKPGVVLFLFGCRNEEAEEDCSRAVALDGSYAKAFARRATARVALGKLEEAKQDFQEVLKLEPGNKQALNQLQKLQISAASSGLLQTPDATQRRTVQPVDKPTHLRSTQIKPEAFADILRNSLEPELLNRLLSALHGFYMRNEAPAVTLEVLRSLASVRRFDMAVMFLSAPEKKDLKELFDFLQRAAPEGSSVAALQKKYGV